MIKQSRSGMRQSWVQILLLPTTHSSVTSVTLPCLSRAEKLGFRWEWRLRQFHWEISNNMEMLDRTQVVADSDGHCISYPLLCNKLSPNLMAQNNKLLFPHGSCGPGIRIQFSYVPLCFSRGGNDGVSWDCHHLKPWQMWWNLGLPFYYLFSAHLLWFLFFFFKWNLELCLVPSLFPSLCGVCLLCYIIP